MKQLIGMLAALFIFVPGASFADNQVTQDALGNMRLGDPNAPVTVTAYSVMTCPGCQYWHKSVFPWLKRTYIDQGKVLFVFVEAPVGSDSQMNNDYWAYMVARCAGPDHYFDMIDFMLRNSGYAINQEISAEARRMKVDYESATRYAAGRRAGLTDGQIYDCENNAAVWQAIDERYRTNWQVLHDADPSNKIGNSPWFLVNGHALTGTDRYEMKGMRRAIEAMLTGH